MVLFKINPHHLLVFLEPLAAQDRLELEDRQALVRILDRVDYLEQLVQTELLEPQVPLELEQIQDRLDFLEE